MTFATFMLDVAAVLSGCLVGNAIYYAFLWPRQLTRRTVVVTDPNSPIHGVPFTTFGDEQHGRVCALLREAGFEYEVQE